MAPPQLARQRVWAWCIDLLICLGLGMLFSAAGWIVSTAYWLCRDGLFDGQSIGKRLMELKVLVQPGRTRCTLKASALRNLLWVLPLVNVVMGLTGFHHLFHDPHGRHWGDRLAGTVVVKA